MTSPAAVTPEQVRAELTSWVQDNWDPGLPLLRWRRLLLESGWAVPGRPARWHGRGLPAWADEIAASELIRLGAVGRWVEGQRPPAGCPRYSSAAATDHSAAGHRAWSTSA